MSVSLVLTLIGADKPGLVELLSQTIAAHGGNWLESRMSRLAGRFAGILRASVPKENADALTEALRALESQGLRVVVERSMVDEPEEAFRPIHLELVGTDRPGIIREISQLLARRRVNVDDLHTECTSAPMSGEILFNARAKLRVPSETSLEELREALEELADDLMVDIVFDEAPGCAPSGPRR